MSDWQVGDLAVCVVVGPLPNTKGDTLALSLGQVYTVEAVGANWRGDVGLILCGIRSKGHLGGFHAQRFRKIRPDKHEACEEEFVTLLKRKKVSA